MDDFEVRRQRVSDSEKFYDILNNDNFEYFDVRPTSVLEQEKYMFENERKEKEGIDYYILANDYLELSEENKLFYVMGLIDMVFFQIYSYDFELYSDITKATDGMNAKQIKAIFDKYIEEHPKKWHFPASLIFNDVIMEIVYEK